MTFHEAFERNMQSLGGLPAPSTLFETIGTALATMGAIAQGIVAYGPKVSMRELAHKLPLLLGLPAVAASATLANLTAVAGGITATFYLATCVASVLVATQQTVSMRTLLQTATAHRLPGGRLMPAFAEIAARMVAGQANPTLGRQP